MVFDKTCEVESRGADKYGRTIGRVSVDGGDVNAAMLDSGMAWHYSSMTTGERWPVVRWAQSRLRSALGANRNLSRRGTGERCRGRAARGRWSAMMTLRRSFAVLFAMVFSAAMGDVIVMKTGEKITGKVTRFEHGKTSLANGHFVINAGGKEQKIPLFKVDSVTFGSDIAPPAEAATSARQVVPPATSRAATTQPADAPSGDYWLSSSGKRHNSSCRYYKSSKGGPCGAKDGEACKTCGG